MIINQKILAQTSGLFGQITVGKTFFPSLYWLKINDEIEGQVFADNEGKPGYIAASHYLYAFIIPAWHFPTSEALMLGLGSGAGATMLLTLFPQLTLTVVEIDPEIIRLTRSYFPLISFYETQGRLHIIGADAYSYVRKCQKTFAFVLLDLFIGDENNQYNFGLLDEIPSITPYFMANVIANKAMLPSTLDEFLWIQTTPASSTQKSNWILTNMQEFSPAIGDFELFLSSQQKKSTIKTANHHFHYILSQIQASCFYQ